VAADGVEAPARPRPLLRDLKSFVRLRDDLAAARRLLGSVLQGGNLSDVAAACEKRLSRVEAILDQVLPQESIVELHPARCLLVNGCALRLTRQEFTVVLALAANRHQHTPRSTLLLVLEHDPDVTLPQAHLINVLVSSVRRKLWKATGRSSLIGHKKGRGFRLKDAILDTEPSVPPARWHLDEAVLQRLLTDTGLAPFD
jgi:DNA-binding response OmpR family regulator